MSDTPRDRDRDFVPYDPAAFDRAKAATEAMFLELRGDGPPRTLEESIARQERLIAIVADQAVMLIELARTVAMMDRNVIANQDRLADVVEHVAEQAEAGGDEGEAWKRGLDPDTDDDDDDL